MNNKPQIVFTEKNVEPFVDVSPSTNNPGYITVKYGYRIKHNDEVLITVGDWSLIKDFLEAAVSIARNSISIDARAGLLKQLSVNSNAGKFFDDGWHGEDPDDAINPIACTDSEYGNWHEEYSAEYHLTFNRTLVIVRMLHEKWPKNDAE